MNKESMQTGRGQNQLTYLQPGGAATKFRLGGGGTDSVESNHLLPNSDFSSDLAHFILEILENLNTLVNIHKILFKKSRFLGGRLPDFSSGGTRRPLPPPPMAAPMLQPLCLIAHEAPE